MSLDRALHRGMADLKQEVVKALSAPQNGTKLLAAMVQVLTEYYLNVAKIGDVDEINTEDIDELLALAKEAWSEAHGEELPQMHVVRISKWAGAVYPSGKVSKGELASPIVGDFTEEDKVSAARKETVDMDLSSFEKEKAIKDMAAQGLSCARLVALSLSLVLGKVSKPSVSAGLKYGEDPALSEQAKQSRKAGRKMLSGIIKERNFATTGAYFSDLMSNYAADGMVEEASLLAAWWAETASCFSAEKELLFEYLDEYFNKYAGRGLPIKIDTVLVTRLRNSTGGGVSKEEFKTVKSKLEALESSMAKIKTENNTLKQTMETIKKKGTTKVTPEEQDERRKKVKCHNCGKMGHYQSECPELKNKDEDE